MPGFEIIETTDKDKRDDIFDRLRTTGEDNERQAVRFSSVRPVMAGESEFALDDKGRVRYESVWSVAYPREGPQWKRR